MSKRAEQKALEAYPKSEKYTSSQRLIINDLRDGFIQGYKQAEKDTIERVCEWLIDRASYYMSTEAMCETLRRAMEEE